MYVYWFARIMLFSACLVGANAYPQDGILGAGSTSGISGRVYDLLADYQLASDEFAGERHCLVGTGAMIRHTDDGVMESGIIFLAVNETDGTQLVANSIVVPSSTNRVVERWTQRLKNDAKVYLRGSPYSMKEAEEFDADDEKLKERRVRAIELRPFNQALSSPSVLRSGRAPNRPVENLLAEGCTLLDASYLESGDLVATFSSETAPDPTIVGRPPSKLILTVTFGKQSSYFPTTCVFTVEMAGKKRKFAWVSTKWHKVKGAWVPASYEGTYFSASGEEHLYRVSYRYKIGEDMPTGLIDVRLPDWREPVRNLFQVEWQRQGVLPPFLNREEE